MDIRVQIRLSGSQSKKTWGSGLGDEGRNEFFVVLRGGWLIEQIT